MYGALLGDMIGAPYEFDRGNKTKEFPLFGRGTEFTDDSVMTIAVAEALVDALPDAEDDWTEHRLVASMQKWGRKYPYAGYGGRFHGWLRLKDPKPYGSYGNGSAMRVSAAGWLYDTLEKTEHQAFLTSKVTHNHPEGIKGAVVTAGCIFLARTGAGKDEIRAYAEGKGYDLSHTCDEIRPTYHHVESCQETVPEAITAFLEGTDFEDVVRTAVSLGGDCDTLTCIAGSIAEAFYGVPEEMKAECRKRLPKDMLKVLDRFEEHRAEAIPSVPITSELLEDGSFLKRAVEICIRNRTPLNLIKLARILRDSPVLVPCSAILSDADYEHVKKLALEFQEKREGEADPLIGQEITMQDEVRLVPDILQQDDKYYFPVFTSDEEMGEYGNSFSHVRTHFVNAIQLAKENKGEVAGIVINAFSDQFEIGREIFDLIAGMDSSIEQDTAAVSSRHFPP